MHNMIDELIAKYLLQEATVIEIARVENWIAENESNKKQFEHFKFLWEESKKFAATNTADEDIAWQKFKKKLNEPKVEGKVISLNKFSWVKIAAAVILVIVCGWSFYSILSKEGSNKLLLVQTKMNVLVDTLPDNSIVTLNKNSSIEYDPKFTKGNQRNIKLKGEAFFSVTPNKEKPFLIKVNDIEVKVVGTSFNIKTVNGQTEVIVKTGVVQVTKNGKTITLMPKEKVITSSTSNDITKEITTDKLFNYYQSKEFVCEGTPLWRLVEVLNEAYGTNIIIENKNLSNLAITTTFANESLDTVLQIVATTFQLKIIKKGDQIILQ